MGKLTTFRTCSKFVTSGSLIITQCTACCHNSANRSENISSGFCPSSRLSGRFHDGRTVLRNSFNPRMADYFSRR